jgi:hypothetical protein
MMNQRMFEQLAQQHVADLQGPATGRSRAPRAVGAPVIEADAASRLPRAQHPSLRERTGWTLVSLGLRLASPASAALRTR